MVLCVRLLSPLFATTAVCADRFYRYEFLRVLALLSVLSRLHLPYVYNQRNNWIVNATTTSPFLLILSILPVASRETDPQYVHTKNAGELRASQMRPDYILLLGMVGDRKHHRVSGVRRNARMANFELRKKSKTKKKPMFSNQVVEKGSKGKEPVVEVLFFPRLNRYTPPFFFLRSASSYYYAQHILDGLGKKKRSTYRNTTKNICNFHSRRVPTPFTKD